MKIKSYAKVNVFLKIVGLRGSYHELVSRFVKVWNLFDKISFEPKRDKGFKIEGNFHCDVKSNTIYKAYLLLKEKRAEIESFFDAYAVKVEKNIPEFAGLGGGSSNAASFLVLSNEVLSLNFTKDELAKMGEKIGADVPFFVYDYNSANVSGIGEIVEPFEEERLKFDIITPPIKCDTAKVYRKFRENLKKGEDILKKNEELASVLKELSSKEIMERFEPKTLNDLLSPALLLCSGLDRYGKDMFFSGSGSSFFKVRDE